jgi:formylglycine-generating enzyme required for sulfatase activity
MGCSPDDDLCDPDESPLHEVYLDDYFIDKYEVTNARYAACVDAGECAMPARLNSATRSQYFGFAAYDDFPVISVLWHQANEFCQWEGKRLPTEAEWEKAARGSRDTRLYPWGNEKPECFRLNSEAAARGSSGACTGDTTAVGSYALGMSPYGVMDMAGNVAEWVSDYYADDYYARSPAGSPPGPTFGEDRVARGGEYWDEEDHVRVSQRFLASHVHEEELGFRCARTPAPDEAPFPASTPIVLPAVTATPPVRPQTIEFREEVLIPAGPFQMNCRFGEPACGRDESAMHEVYVDDYSIDKYEVTNARYLACVDAGVCKTLYSWERHSTTHEWYYENPDFFDYPVIYVSWIQADAFCRWEGKRLPTEAEWEKAARGSRDTRVYPWGNEEPDCSRLNQDNYPDGGDCVGDTTQVGSYPTGASPSGVMDMAGNVREWVDGSYYFVTPGVDRYGDDLSKRRVVRGGSWDAASWANEISEREDSTPDFAWGDLGFRCARTP